MSYLVNRNAQIPNGLTFHVPEVNWMPRRNSSFHGIVEALQRLVESDPSLQAKYPKSYAELADLVDQYNASICLLNGWTQYVQGPGGAPSDRPFLVRRATLSQLTAPPQPLKHVQQLRDVVEGGQTLVEWLVSDKDAVHFEQANWRAKLCSDCPKNEKGNWLRFFTVPVANAVRMAHEHYHNIKLETPFDEQLGVCTACSCPLRLKVHFKIEDLKVKLTDEMIKDLDPRCWIPKELYGQTTEPKHADP